MSLAGRPKFKIQRQLNVELPGLGKAGALSKKGYAPGQHGKKRGKPSDYRIRLFEKQKLAYHYGIRERQLYLYIKKSKRDTSRPAWIESLIIMMERRLDNVIFRLNFATSIPGARQLVVHHHVLVNGAKVKSPGYQVQVGDVISLSAKGYKTETYKRALTSPRITDVPTCLEVEVLEEDKKRGKMVEQPLPSDIPFEFNGGLVTEFYGKVKR